MFSGNIYELFIILSNFQLSINLAKRERDKVGKIVFENACFNWSLLSLLCGKEQPKAAPSAHSSSKIWRNHENGPLEIWLQDSDLNLISLFSFFFFSVGKEFNQLKSNILSSVFFRCLFSFNLIKRKVSISSFSKHFESSIFFL